MYKYSYQRRLHWSECDPVGIIFFPHYARWVADGLHEMFLGLGVDPTGIYDGNIRRGLPIVSLSIKFHAAPALHEEVDHRILIQKVGTKSLSFRHEFRRGDSLLAEAEDVRVWTTHVVGQPDSLKAVPIPPEIRALLEDAGVSAQTADVRA
jgi:4-hydroxybenzoyl-CoA thioesterase